MDIRIRLQQEIFDPGEESNRFLKETATVGAGATVTFTGLVRSDPDNPIHSLTLEHYPALARAQLDDITREASTRFPLMAITIIHRFGEMLPGEPIVQVMTLSPHRQAAFEGAQFIMDFLKTDAPFWKKEKGNDGESWVDAKACDDRARDRWR